MTILVLPGYYFPENVSSVHLDQDRDRSFVDYGYSVRVIAPRPCRGIPEETYKKYRRIKTETLYESKLEIIRFSMFKEGHNPFVRALRYSFCWIKQLNRGLLSRDIDCVYLSSTPPIQGLLGVFIKKIKKVPFVYNLQDVFPDSLSGTGLAKEGGILWKIGASISNCIYRNSDRIIVISNDIKQNIIAKGVPAEKIDVVYNWVDENAVFPVADADNPLFDEFGISRNIFRVVYAGNLGNAQNIGLIMDAAAKMKDNPDVEFIIFGKGGMEDEIRGRIAVENLTNIKLLPLQPMERVPYVYSLGNVCVVACKPGLGGAAMPSKTWSIMACGSAVLANFDEGELKTIIERNECGVFTKAGDVDEFVSAIETLASTPERCEKMGERGREFILKNLTKEVGTSKYVEVIKRVIEKKQNNES